jgi:O-antigen biosynthesis protein
MNVFLLYNYSSGTTGDFIERAFRKLEKETSDLKIITNRDLPLPVKHTGEGIKTVCEKLKIDWLIQIDSGGAFNLPIDMGKTKTLFYSIDTFFNPERVKAGLTKYDLIAYAQKKFVVKDNEFWWALGADVDVYKPKMVRKKYDVAFCGTFLDKISQNERNEYLEQLVLNHNVYIGRDYNEWANLRYNEAFFVFNRGINDDLNMRVFEGMASGSVLLMNEVDTLKDFFKPDIHYIEYKDKKELIQIIFDRRMDVDALRTISDNAIKEIREKHTYYHRVKELYEKIRK